MNRSRPAAVAGAFYPGRPETLTRDVDAMLADASARLETNPRALIVPHAGYVYSGPIAASAYVELARLRDQVTRVVLIGPSHRVPFRGVALPTTAAFETPLGDVLLDEEAMARIDGLPGVQRRDDAHAYEHSLEVQLPFLQRALGDFVLVPIVIGMAAPEEVAPVIDALWSDADPSTLLLVSSDLSHYLPDAEARTFDQRTTQAIEGLAPERIERDGACGRIGIQALLLLAKARGLRVTTLDVRNSSDTAGSPDQVVGYGAWAVHG